jgi:Kdo2-lipid IVA lauroyltransferase/acyltransferase
LDIFSLALLHIIKYRKKVVLTNLQLSFPEKSEKEISEIAGKFYRHLADIILGTIKGYSMSWECFTKRITFLGLGKMNGYYDKGKNIVLLGMHYNNWEWSVTSQRLMKHKSLLLYGRSEAIHSLRNTCCISGKSGEPNTFPYINPPG